ncbi:unnamed protein product [Ectocarpus sp. 12 AP-2014]
MKSTFVMIGALCCGASSAGAFVLPVGRPSGSSSSSSSLAARRTFNRRTPGGASMMMSSVAEPPAAKSTAAQEPERRPIVQQAIDSNDDYVSAMAQHQDKLVVIKFYDQFCRACDEIRPRYEDLSRSHPEEDAVFFDVEFSGAKDLCKQLGIMRLPTVQIYDGTNGRVADLPAGPSRFTDVEEKFAAVISSKKGSEQDAVEAVAE